MLLYMVQIIFQTEEIIGHENFNVCFERFYCLMLSSEQSFPSLQMFEFSLLSGFWCLILMFSVKHRNVLWETIKAFFKYEVVSLMAAMNLL